MTSGRRLFCLLLSIVVAPMKKFTLQSLKVADGKLSERSCWLVKAQLEEPEEQVVWGPAPFALTGKGLVASAYSTRTTAQGFLRSNQIAPRHK